MLLLKHEPAQPNDAGAPSVSFETRDPPSLPPGDAGAPIFQGDPFTASSKPLLIGVVSLSRGQLPPPPPQGAPEPTGAAAGTAAAGEGAAAAGGAEGRGCVAEVTGLRLDDSTSQLFLRAHGAAVPRGRRLRV
jgi:hypothetical protein